LYTLGEYPKPDWDSLYASQPEVLAYWEALIDKFELRSAFLFNSEFAGSKWDATKQIHNVTFRNVTTGALADLDAEVLISATGPVAKRKLPNVPGRDSFQGPWFHNLDWDGSVQLVGKRIAVVGNGSSGVQIVVSASGSYRGRS
jgi:cation diffusion facilitator CzcD-associated flavoprotein CzcO